MLLRSDQQTHRRGYEEKKRNKSIGITLISTKSIDRRENEGGLMYMRKQRIREEKGCEYYTN